MQARSHATYRTFAPVLLVGATLAGLLFLVPNQREEPVTKNQEMLTEGDQDSVNRIMQKNMIVDDLLEGVITWPEALEFYLDAAMGNPQSLANLQQFDPESPSLRETVARQLLRFIYARIEQDHERFAPTLRIILDAAKQDLGQI